MYRIIGYYICEKLKTSNRLRENSEQMISVSDCFGGIHPDLSCCFFTNDKKDDRYKYCKKWNLDGDELTSLQRDIGGIFGRRLGVDGRFLTKADAQYFLKKYFSEDKCVVVSVSTTDEYYDTLKNELTETSGANNSFFCDNIDESELLGFDILGWDISGFHTFLCNNLQSALPAAKFNKLILLENDYEEVKEFAKQIQDMGEPVEWIPCRIGKCYGLF